jgi:hypothetical protein
MSFASAQVFKVDPNLVAGSPQIGITGVDLFFKAKPAATNNLSGIKNPGVNVFLLPTISGVPNLDVLVQAPRARVEYANITVSNTATVATKFSFNPPAPVKTGLNYSIVIQFDGNEAFELWTCKKGDVDVRDQATVISGPSDKNAGDYFSYISPVPLSAPASAAVSGLGTTAWADTSATAPSSYTASAWSPLTSIDLKFNIYCARFAVSGNTDLSGTGSTIHSSPSVANSTSNEYVFTIPSRRYEYCLYDRNQNSATAVKAGERIYVDGPSWPGGVATPSKLSISQGTNLIVASGGANVNFSTIFHPSSNDEYVVLVSKNHDGAGLDRVCIRQVANIVSNTSFTVTENVTFTNTACEFIRSPVAVVDQFVTGSIFDTQQDMLVLVDSNANSSVRFVGNSIMSANIVNGGHSYSNTDTVTFGGYESVAGKVLGNYSAKATLVTYANGTISGLLFSNVGSGFSNAAAVTATFANSTGGASGGAGANLVPVIGSTLRAEHLGLNGNTGRFFGCTFVNIDVDTQVPTIPVNNPAGTFYTAFQRLPYYGLTDGAVSTGRAAYCDADAGVDFLQIKDGVPTKPSDLKKRRILPSWSNEFNIPYANGSPCNAAGGSTVGSSLPYTSNASVMVLEVAAHNDFALFFLQSNTAYSSFARYSINNDASGETGNKGAALARGIEKKITLKGTNAEDILVNVSAHRPVGTDVLCFVKFYNSHDNDAFEDKDWTKLTLVDGIGAYSSPDKADDFVEMQWGLSKWPANTTQLSGTVTVVSNNVTITGAGTDWSSNTSSNLVAGSLVLLQNPLFPMNYATAVVSSVANNTSFTIMEPIANVDVVGTGLRISKINEPHQAFSNWLNSNVIRYYNSAMAEFDTYDTFQVKFVFTSSSTTLIPYLDEGHGVAVSV